MQGLIYNNSIDEEDKAIIHKMNQQLLCLLSLWKQQDMYSSKKLYHLYLI